MADYQERLTALKTKLNIGQKQAQIDQINQASGQPSFWQNPETSGQQMKLLAELKAELTEIEELDILLELQPDQTFEKRLQKLELKTFFSGPYDQGEAILAIHSGQGGTEAMDWANMLRRMYCRYFERKTWTFDLIEETLGEEAGIKSVTYKVHGQYAYGYLKHEAGTHRLVRQSPFNADNLRQTSFALVEVLPVVTGTEIEIKDSELDWQFTHSSGHGGQNVQKVSTAVRLRHLPTGIITSAQSERYQEQNRQIALDILKGKLWAIAEEKRKTEEQTLKGGRTQAAWGTQIRSYVLHPYKMVKDLRTDWETSNTDAILDGELEDLIEAEIKAMV